MATIANLTGRPVLVRLNSGTVLHLPPEGRSPELADAEVQDNGEITKLQERLTIALHMGDDAGAGGRGASRPARKPAGAHREGES